MDNPNQLLDDLVKALVCRRRNARGPSVKIERDSDPQEMRNLMNQADENWNRRASPASASVAAPDYRIADRGFRWDAENRQHIPQLLIEFTPVPENAPNASSGWKDRDKLAAMLAAAPVLNRIKESNDDVLVMDALRSGEWRITKSIPCECLTDEANAKSAWYVERMCAPFCDDKNFRSWFGRTPIEALSNGKDAIRARADELEKTNG